MDIIATPSAQSLRRLWRRKRYQRLRSSSSSSSTGPARSSRSFRLRWLWRRRMRIRSKAASKKLLLRLSPLKLLARFHDAYVEMMMRVANSVGNMYAIGAFGNGNKKIPFPKPQTQASLVSCGEQVVDAKLVLQIYNKLAASKNNFPTSAFQEC